MPDIKVLTLLGSLRAASINRQIAELATEAAPDGVAVTMRMPPWWSPRNTTGATRP
jgi:hypothetical protein